MQPLLIPVAILFLAASAGVSAQVVRCVDAAGKTSYTDQRCPPNTRQATQVLGIEASAPPPNPAGDAAAAEATRRAAPVEAAAPAGPSAAERRAFELAAAQQREIDRLREQDRQREAERQQEVERLRREADDARSTSYYGADPYAGVPGFRPPPRPQDMRPRIQGCDGGGCHDNQGNTYNRNTGQLDRYQSLDGRTCQPVGTTVVCR